jgi:GNAT superfamily N-acetyltransferase
MLSDLEELVDLLKTLFAIEKDFVFNAAVQRRGLALMLEGGGDSRCLKVAEVDQEIIGMCSAQMLISTAEGGRSALVEDLVVKTARQSGNIGSQLLQAIESWAGENGAARLQLLVDQTNLPALAFYEKRNWQRTRMICLRKST